MQAGGLAGYVDQDRLILVGMIGVRSRHETKKPADGGLLNGKNERRSGCHVREFRMLFEIIDDESAACDDLQPVRADLLQRTLHEF